MNWKYLHQEPVNTLPELEAVLLRNRDIESPESFFNPISPLAMSLATVGIDQEQVSRVILRLEKALAAKEDILVFGDYDADGISATAVMWLTLYKLGFNARPFIPHREKHGYGLSTGAISEIVAQKKPSLIITVDNGIVAHAAVEKLNLEAVEVIITDHHQPEFSAGNADFPPALAIVHTTQLCGTTVAWMFAKALWQHFKPDEAEVELNELLDLCGLATIADQVPLVAANRSFATYGVKALQTSSRPGIKMLCQGSDTDQKTLSVGTVNYIIAPRINAMGRLDHGLDALRLLCTTNIARAQQLASTLNSTNTRRQTLTDDLLKLAQAEAETWKNEHLIVVASESFHEGVIGLIAGRLTEKYHKPSIVLSVGPEKAKASARSIAGVNIIELIREVRADLLEVGGHPMAAGFGVAREKLELVKARLLSLAKDQISVEHLTPTLTIECSLSPALINKKFWSVLQKFEPFGQGNPTPIFSLHDMKVLETALIGKEGQHLKVSVCENRETAVQALNAIGWRMGGHQVQLDQQTCVDLAGCVELNEWKGRQSFQFLIKDIHYS